MVTVVTITGESVYTTVVMMAGVAVDTSVWIVAGPSAMTPSTCVTVSKTGPEVGVEEAATLGAKLWGARAEGDGPLLPESEAVQV